MTRPARLGRVAGRFFRELQRALPEAVKSSSYRSAVGGTLEKRRYRDFRPGLEKAAELAWREFGSANVRAYLADQQRLATTALKADRWNRTSRARLSEVLGLTIRDGEQELNLPDIVDALTVCHGVPILAESIRARYARPENPEHLGAEWQAALPEILEKSFLGSPIGDRTGWKNGTVSYTRLVSELTRDMSAWPEAPSAPRVASRIGRVNDLLRHAWTRPREAMEDLSACLKDASRRLPIEVSAALIYAMAVANIAREVSDSPEMGAVAVAAWGLSQAAVGWLGADAFSKAGHVMLDFWPGGHGGREFLMHHLYPRFAFFHSTVQCLAANSNQALAIAAMVTLVGCFSATGLTAGAVAAIGVLHILHSHSHGGHRNRSDHVSLPFEIMQRLCLFLRPTWHARHHPKDIAGHRDHAVLNGWTDWLLRPLKFDPALLGGLRRISDWARSVDAPQAPFPRRLIESLRRLRPDVLDNKALWHIREIMCESGWGDVAQAKFVYDVLMQTAASLGIEPGAVQRELQALSKNIERGELEELPPILRHLGVVLIEPSLGRRPLPLFPHTAGAGAV